MARRKVKCFVTKKVVDNDALKITVRQSFVRNSKHYTLHTYIAIIINNSRSVELENILGQDFVLTKLVAKTQRIFVCLSESSEKAKRNFAS